tara:strand:+ start:872 stop:1795 length:924 start_codon:yes stop_codon:yes gene_type:complete
MSKIEVDEISNQSGDQDSGVDLSTNDVVAVKTANTERMRVDASGRLNVGQTSAYAPSGSGVSIATFKEGSDSRTNLVVSNQNSGSSAGSAIVMGVHGADYIIEAQGSGKGGALTFTKSTDERMRIDSSGNVHVGRTDTMNMGANGVIGINLQADGQIQASVSGDAHHFARQSSFGEVLRFACAGTSNVGSIDVTTSATSYNTSSDYRLKENVVTDWDATSRLKQLKPSRFNFKIDKDMTLDGFIAHEVSGIVPEAISGKKDAVDADGNIEPQGIDQSKLVPLLTKALQEAVAKIETLEAKVTALESK